MTASLTDDRNEPLKKALTHGLAFWAIAAPLWVLVNSAFGGRFALDFHHAYLPAAHAVLHGASPYSGSSSAVTAGEAFVYPPVSAFLLVPFTLLPLHAAELLATVLVAASVPATLLVLGVRDWRCHAIAFLWWPTIIAIQSANVTLLLLLGVALAWRFRDRPLVVAIATGLVVAVKPFFWPLLLWLAATRRYRSLALASVVSFVLVVVPWAGIGFAGLHGYPHLLTSVSRVDGARSYSVAALLHLVASTSWTVATTTETVIGAGLVLLVIAAGRRGRDRDAIALAVVAILAADAAVGDAVSHDTPRGRRPLSSQARCGLGGTPPHLGSGGKRARWPSYSMRARVACRCRHRHPRDDRLEASGAPLDAETGGGVKPCGISSAHALGCPFVRQPTTDQTVSGT